MVTCDASQHQEQNFQSQSKSDLSIWSIALFPGTKNDMMTPDDSCHPSTLPAVFLCWSDQLQPGGPWEWHPKREPARCSSSSRWWHWARRNGWSELPAERGPVTKAPPSINATEGWEGDKVVMQGVIDMYVSAAKNPTKFPSDRSVIGILAPLSH